MSSISPITTASAGIQPIDFPSLDTTQEAGTSSSSEGFGSQLTNALNSVQGSQTNADSQAMQMATGDASDVSDFMIAANQAQIATQLTVAVKNKAIDSFNQIMNMQV